MIPFRCSGSGGSQEKNSEREVSALTVKLNGGLEGAVENRGIDLLKLDGQVIRNTLVKYNKIMEAKCCHCGNRK